MTCVSQFQEIINALIIGGLFLLIFDLGERIRHKYPVNSELSRKTVHLLGGLIALSFPYIFQSHWTVLALSFSFGFIIFYSKKKGLLKSVHDVKRVSHGGIYYPLAVYLIFLLSSSRPVIYSVSILVMAMSDTMAALIGGKYGSIKFDVEGNLKSLEGSVAFFFITFLAIHLPLLLVTNTGRIESVLIAFIIAVLVTGFEIISVSGSDNIFVPFGTYFILTKMTRLPLETIVQNLRDLFIISALTILLMFRPRLLKPSGVVGMMLLNYAAISLCGFYWFLPLLLAQISYYLLVYVFVLYEGKEKIVSFQIKVLFYLGIIPTFLLFIANANNNSMTYYLPYLTAITSQMAIIFNYFFVKYLNRSFKTEGYIKKQRKFLEITCSISATLFVAGSPILLYTKSDYSLSLLIVIIGTWISYMLNFMMNKYYRGVKNDIFEYRRRFVSAAIGVMCVFLLQKIMLP